MDSPELDSTCPSAACYTATEGLEIVKWNQKTYPLPQRLAQLMEQLSLGRKSVVVAIGGPGGTGKTTLSKLISRHLPKATTIHLDDYRYPRSVRANLGLMGTHPEANNIALIKEHLRSIRSGQRIEKPIYNVVSGTAKDVESINCGPITILDGEISTYQELRQEIDLSIFIDSHWKTQLNRRIERDIGQRAYSPEKVISTFLQSNLRDYPRFGTPSQQWSQIRVWFDNNNQYRLVAAEKKLIPLLEIR